MKRSSEKAVQKLLSNISAWKHPAKLLKEIERNLVQWFFLAQSLQTTFPHNNVFTSLPYSSTLQLIPNICVLQWSTILKSVNR